MLRIQCNLGGWEVIFATGMAGKSILKITFVTGMAGEVNAIGMAGKSILKFTFVTVGKVNATGVAGKSILSGWPGKSMLPGCLGSQF